MKFFHIKYECNDARDDFSAQRRQAEKGMSTSLYMSNKDMDELDTQAYMYEVQQSQEELQEDIVNARGWKKLSAAEVLTKACMQEIQKMTLVGWIQ